jgi:hypothetical protein
LTSVSFASSPPSSALLYTLYKRSDEEASAGKKHPSLRPGSPDVRPFDEG